MIAPRRVVVGTAFFGLFTRFSLTDRLWFASFPKLDAMEYIHFGLLIIFSACEIVGVYVNLRWIAWAYNFSSWESGELVVSIIEPNPWFQN